MIPKRRIIAWKVDGPPNPSPVWPIVYDQPAQQPVHYEAAEPILQAIAHRDREDRIQLWRGIRRRLSGAGRRLPEASQETVERLLSEVEAHLGQQER